MTEYQAVLVLAAVVGILAIEVIIGAVVLYRNLNKEEDRWSI